MAVLNWDIQTIHNLSNLIGSYRSVIFLISDSHQTQLIRPLSSQKPTSAQPNLSRFYELSNSTEFAA